MIPQQFEQYLATPHGRGLLEAHAENFADQALPRIALGLRLRRLAGPRGVRNEQLPAGARPALRPRRPAIKRSRRNELAIVLLAFVAMIVQDVPGVIMTQAAARDRANLTGLLDTLGWLAGIMTTSVSVTALRGHNWPFKIAVIAAVSVANYVGSVTGVLIGKKFVKAAKS